MPYDESAEGARQLWEAIPRLLSEGLESARHDFGALECLANDPSYAKPDSLKFFALWEATRVLGDGIMIEVVPGWSKRHLWVYKLFVGPDSVRFPFNIEDSDATYSLSWATIEPPLSDEDREQARWKLPRWSTASRSCLALIPENVRALDPIVKATVDGLLSKRLPVEARPPNSASVVPKPAVHVPEWNAREVGRFFTVVKELGKAASEGGIELGCNPARPVGDFNPKCRWRLYSVKTGVNYVGSMDEATTGGKHRLETNSAMAMVRSGVIQEFPILDNTFAVQTEVLTITAPMGDGGRDGFQVRDLSAMKTGLVYMPGQAIPYARKAFDGYSENRVDEQCRFWRRTFAVPLGRAKARLLLNFGLVHMSANAQNFLVGFEPDARVASQFLARDIGDTSWHDVYLKRYFDGTSPFSASVFASYQEEDRQEYAHTLQKPPTGNYPAPQIMRLGAYQTLSHDFGKMLQERQKWNTLHLYRFAAGILEGFRNYFEAALFDGNPLHPSPASNSLRRELRGLARSARAKRIGDEYALFEQYGAIGKFPPDPGKVQQYKAKVLEAVGLTHAKAFEMVDAMRQFSECLTADDLDGLDKKALDVLINAEELLMCAGLEERMGMAKDQQRDPNIAKTIKLLLLNDRSWPKVVPNTRDVNA